MLCIILITLAACHKHEELQTVSTYSFTNTTDARITFDIYGSRDDYSNNRNRIKQYYIERGSTATIPLEALKNFWIDWYNEDYTLNNWVDSINSGGAFSDAIPKPQIAVANEDDHYFIGSTHSDTSRSILLNGDGSSSSWQTTISNEPDLNGTHTFLLRKDFSGQYTTTGPSGTSVVTPIMFVVTNEQHALFSVMIFKKGQINHFVELYFNAGVYSYPYPFSYYGRDTLVANFIKTNGYPYTHAYPARRQ